MDEFSFNTSPFGPVRCAGLLLEEKGAGQSRAGGLSFITLPSGPDGFGGLLSVRSGLLD